MLQSSRKGYNYDFKIRREVNVYQDSLVKIITLVSVFVKVVSSSLSLVSNNSDNILYAVINYSAFQKFTTIIFRIYKDYFFLCLDISFKNKRLDDEVHNNALFKLDEK